MTDSFIRQSPLAPLGLAARVRIAAGAGVVLAEVPQRGQIALRGDASKKAFRDAVARAVGIAPPDRPNLVAGPADLALGPRALWLGPEEWLVATAPDATAATLNALSKALADHHAAVVDVSDARAVIRLSGPAARAVLMKGCSLDFHPHAFAPGQCGQSLLARAGILIHQVTIEPVYEIYVARSFAHYLWTWLEDAASEYGVAIGSA